MALFSMTSVLRSGKETLYIFVVLCYIVSVAVGNVWAAHTKIPTALNCFVLCLSTVLYEERETG